MKNRSQKGAVGLAAVSFVAWLLTAGSASAQKPTIDPKAQEALKQSSAVYKSLHAYSCEAITELKVDSLPGSRVINLKIVFQKPNMAAISEEKYGEKQQFFADGRNIYSYSAEKNEYFVTAVPVNIPPAAPVLTQGESFIGLMLLKPDGLLIDNGNIQSLTLGTPAILSGVPVQTVTKVMRTRNGGHLTFFISFGIKDHLIYRFVSTLQSSTPLPVGDVKTKRIDTTEDYSNIQLNKDLPSTSFLPPVTAKKVEPDKEDPTQENQK